MNGEPMNLKPVVSVLLAAALFGVSTPLAKFLLRDVRPLALAGLLYLGVFLGLTVFKWALRAAAAGEGLSSRGGTVRLGVRRAASREAALEKKDWPWLAGAIVAGGGVVRRIE
jgi:hypothetical protein